MPNNNNLLTEDFISTSDDINVEEIMTAIQSRIKEKKDSGVLKQSEIDEIEDMELLPLPDFLEIPNVYQPHLYPGTENPNEPIIPMPPFEPQLPSFENEQGPGLRGLVKKILVKIRALVFPLVRFMTRPIYNEMKQQYHDFYNDNANTAHLIAHDLRQLPPVIQQSKEYIKLLHNTINNMIVESSKLKIEEELLKTKLKVLEDKIQFLENRERAIEKKLFENPKPTETKNK